MSGLVATSLETRSAVANQKRRVVVTGLGAVSAFGWGVEALHRGLRSGRTAIANTRCFDTSGQRTEIAGEVPEPATELAARFAGWNNLSQADRFAVAAADEARRQAGLATDEVLTGLFFGGSTAGMLECEEYLRRLLGLSPKHPRLALQASQQVNGPGDAVARQLGITGPTQTISSACSSGALAIAAAVEAIREGDIDAAIAGGADSLCLLTYSGFNSLRSLDERPCRPFRADRLGLSIGEGAGVLVLEPLEAARSRGAEPLAELLGTGASCDAHHMTAPHPEGLGAAIAITQALADAGIEAGQITFINAHGTGTPLNDVSESAAIHQVFGERAASIPVTATKGSVGHLLGSSGAIEAVATILALGDGQVPVTPGDGEVDSELGLDVVLDQPRPIPRAGMAVSTSFAFGGANAALVIRGSADL